MPIRRLDKTLTATTATVAGEDIAASAIPVKPHIQPGVLQPAVAGKLLDGTTSHGATYGVAQSDGHSYYYTDIKGSKPIKDPRIGSHFGSQRYTFKSMQLLEQETATAGHPVSSVDGREWIRTHGASFFIQNDATGNHIGNHDGAHPDANDWIEITGYFNKMNWLAVIYSNTATNVNVVVDGVSASTSFAPDATVNTPLGARYVEASSLQELPVGTLSLGIHTVKIGLSTTYWYASGCELIAQDTTSTATKSKIQIPAQNVVSYGKKFALSAAAHHYNPFAQSQTGAAVTINSSTTNTAKLAGGWSGTGATYYSSELDTATSLGLSAWVSSSEYYRPVNGGRVVWWVNSEGALKCSVNMMPPAGTAIGGQTSGHNVPTGVHNWATKYQPALHSTTIDHSQAEVAKTFHWREFGNGFANGNSNYADASMLNTNDDIAYVMDDGLTSLTADDYYAHNTYGLIRNAVGLDAYCTFIGTGFSMDGWTTAKVQDTIAQNLPYGTHILKIEVNDSSSSIGKWYIDGVEVKNWDSSSGNAIYEHGPLADITIHQPKMPPIPEDAVIVADYMLMADFVKQSTTVTEGTISKGVRVVSGSRDHFYDGTSTFASAGVLATSVQGVYGLRSGVAQTAQLPFFGTRFLAAMEGSNVAHELTINGTSVTEDVYDCSANTQMDLKGIPDANVVALGVNTAKTTLYGSNSGYRYWGTHIDSPIHTSSHYQTFETPFLHELVGGDRNMEQNNLVVTPDGKTWDEVTRDTSYIGASSGFHAGRDGGNIATDGIWFADHWRGRLDYFDPVQKDFTPAYNKVICLKDGWYEIYIEIIASGGADSDIAFYIHVNGVLTQGGSACGDDTRSSQCGLTCTRFLKRGDLLHVSCAVGGMYGGDVNYSNFGATKINK